jgi:hypothetical protein
MMQKILRANSGLPCGYGFRARAYGASRNDGEAFGPAMTIASRDRHFIVGMTNSAPSLTPEGQRAVTVLVLV